MTNEELEKMASEAISQGSFNAGFALLPAIESRLRSQVLDALKAVRDSVVQLPSFDEVREWANEYMKKQPGGIAVGLGLPSMWVLFEWLREQLKTVHQKKWCDHKGGYGPPFPSCEICEPKTVQPISDVPLWIKHDSSIEVYDGSAFAGAVKVKNNKTNKETWEIYTFIVIADGENFSLLNCIEGECGDEFGAWLWEDFEYIIPINEDAERTLSEARILGGKK